MMNSTISASIPSTTTTTTGSEEQLSTPMSSSSSSSPVPTPSLSVSLSLPSVLSSTASSTMSTTTISTPTTPTPTPTPIPTPTPSTPTTSTTTPTTTTTSVTVTQTPVTTTTITVVSATSNSSSQTSTSTTTTVVISPSTSTTPTLSLLPSTSTTTPSTTSSTLTITPTKTTTPTTTSSSAISTPGSSSSAVSPTAELMLTTSTSTQIVAVSTFSTTVFISTTDRYGSTTIFAPPFITSTVTFITDGTQTTSTAVIANPTLNTDNSSPSSFFQNKGAVAGVFTLVGLATISLTLWVCFFIRRRRRELTIQHELTMSASLAAAGFGRPAIDDGDSNMSSRRSIYESTEFVALPMANPDRHRRSIGRMSILPDAYVDDRGRYEPQFAMRHSRESYRDMPSPTTPNLTSPPPSAFAPYRDRTSSDMMEMSATGAGIRHPLHSHHDSGGSLEPLLATRQPRNGPIIRDVPEISIRPTSRTPSTENSSTSTSKPSYLTSLTQPNFYANNSSSHSGLSANGQNGDSEFVNGHEKSDKPESVVEVTEDSITDHELELQKPRVLAVRNLPDAASEVSVP